MPDSPLLRSAALTLATLAIMLAQSNQPKEKASDYTAHVVVPKMELAADFLSHNLPAPGGVIFLRDYLVIEVAAYPQAKSGASWATGQFTLKINKHGTPLLPQSPGMVAASVKYPDWEQHPTAVVEGGIGDGSIMVGQPAPVGRFPGDPNVNRLPPPVRAPEPENPTGEERQPEMTVDEVCLRAALADGPFFVPVNGYLFFPFKGKIKSIHSLQLLFEGTDGTQATLDLL